jgi:type II secretory pathway component GspD/PulD (secretin)
MSIQQSLKSAIALLAAAAAATFAWAQPGPAQMPVPGLGPQPGAATAPAASQFGWPPGMPLPSIQMQPQMQPPSSMQPPSAMPPPQAQTPLQRPAGMLPAQQASSNKPQLPLGPTHLVDLPRMDNRAIRELIISLITRFQLESGYVGASEAQQKLLPAPPQVVPVGAVLARVDPHRKALLIRFGFLRQPGQLPQLWVSGMVAPEPNVPNPDVSLVEPAVSLILASRDKSEAELSMTELRSQVINLAYTDADSAIGMLKAMGFNVSAVDRPSAGMQMGPFGQQGSGGNWGMQQGMPGTWGTQPYMGAFPGIPFQPTTGANGPQRKIRNSELPLIIRMPGPNPQDVGLVGAASDGSNAAPGTGASGVTTILGSTGRLATETLSSPTTQLLVLYNPDRPEQLGLVRKAIAESVDTPARQIVIEAMVLEVTTNGLRELGVQWNYQKGFNTLSIGSLTPGSGNDTLTFDRNTGLTEALVKSFFVKVQALVQSGKAEVLARPSVLTLDNRQATIRIGTDIPIATSRDSSSISDSRVSYSFFYLPTGIQLNVRPRIDNDGSEVSLQVDAAVSSTVANLGTQIRSPGDVVLAAAPAVSTRRVQTYARIPNSTPLIIGGLISRNRDEIADATPLLGEIPVLGALFRGKKDTSSRDEVIIVLTPYVLERGRTGLEAAMPKDAPAFEYSRDNELFRKNVRLRAEDTLNTGYIRENARLVRYRKLVNRIAAVDPTRVDNTPLTLVKGDRTPGEQTLMTGMLYNVLKNHTDGPVIPPERMQLFMERDNGEVVVRNLASVLARLGDGKTPESFFTMHPAKCLTITFTSHRQEMVAGNVLEEPEPKTSVVDCKADRSDWNSMLYGLNRNTDTHEFNAILIKDKSDLLTLSHAIALRRMIQINGGKEAIDFQHLGVGRVLALPEFGEGQNHLLESDIARYFYLSQHYYRAFEEDFEDGMAAVEKLLRSGQYNDMISQDELAPGK